MSAPKDEEQTEPFKATHLRRFEYYRVPSTLCMFGQEECANSALETSQLMMFMCFIQVQVVL